MAKQAELTKIRTLYAQDTAFTAALLEHNNPYAAALYLQQVAAIQPQATSPDECEDYARGMYAEYLYGGMLLGEAAHQQNVAESAGSSDDKLLRAAESRATAVVERAIHMGNILYGPEGSQAYWLLDQVAAGLALGDLLMGRVATYQGTAENSAETFAAARTYYERAYGWIRSMPPNRRVEVDIITAAIRNETLARSHLRELRWRLRLSRTLAALYLSGSSDRATGALVHSRDVALYNSNDARTSALINP